MITPKAQTRITFDFDNERQESYEKLVQIVCSSHWASSIDIHGFMYEDHRLLFEFVKHGIIVINECEYEIQEPYSESDVIFKITLVRNHNNGNNNLDQSNH